MSNWQRFKDGKVFMRINNKEEYDSFAKQCDADGLHWDKTVMFSGEDLNLISNPPYAQLDEYLLTLPTFPYFFIADGENISMEEYGNAFDNFVIYGGGSVELHGKGR